jgi:hypothetical protein
VGCRNRRVCGVVEDEAAHTPAATTTKEPDMPHFTLLIYNPADGFPPDLDFGDMHKRFMAFTEELTKAGELVSNHGLAGADAATTVRVRGGESQITDGPFAETKELLAGIYLIDVPDLDTALDRAARLPSAEYGAVEVRPLWGS